MHTAHSIRGLVIAIVAVAAPCICGTAVQRCAAGIIAPAPVGFDAQDLERSLAADAEAGSAAVPKGDGHTPVAGSERSRRASEHVNAAIPGSQNSPSSSSSSNGSSATGNVAPAALGSSLAVIDDALLGRIVEERGLSVPDPPGADLLRPPRN